MGQTATEIKTKISISNYTQLDSKHGYDEMNLTMQARDFTWAV